MEINWLEYLIIVGLVLLNAFFAASEIAIVTVRKTRIQQLATEGRRSARAILRLSNDTSRFLSTIQVGITLAGFFASAFGALSLVKLLDAGFKSVPVGFIQDAAGTLAFILVTALLAFISIVFGELIPKTLALGATEPIALAVARPIELLSKIAAPIIALLTGVTNFFVRLLGGKNKAAGTSITQEEIQALMQTGHEEGVFEAQERHLINRVFEFSDRQLREIIVPRPDVVSLSSSLTVQEAARQMLAQGYSRYPVYDTNHYETIVGIAYIKDVLKYLLEDQSQQVTLQQILRPPFFVPENKRVGDLLTELQRSRTQLAVVIDEYGGMAGIVTLEDCLEEIVGEIQDEFDAEESRIKTLSPGVYSIDGGADLGAVEQAVGLALEDPEVETLGGLVFKLLGRPAIVGDYVELVTQPFNAKADNFEDDTTTQPASVQVQMKVQKVEGLRIRRVELTNRSLAVAVVDTTPNNTAPGGAN